MCQLPLGCLYHYQDMTWPMLGYVILATVLWFDRWYVVCFCYQAAIRSRVSYYNFDDTSLVRKHVVLEPDYETDEQLLLRITFFPLFLLQDSVIHYLTVLRMKANAVAYHSLKTRDTHIHPAHGAPLWHLHHLQSQTTGLETICRFFPPLVRIWTKGTDWITPTCYGNEKLCSPRGSLQPVLIKPHMTDHCIYLAKHRLY